MKTSALINGTCKIVREDYDEQTVVRITAKAERRFTELLGENAGESRALQAHTVKRIYPGIAVYEAMRSENIPEEKAVWYLREYFQRFCAKAVPVMKGVIALPGVHQKFPELFVKIAQKSFSEEAGFVYEWPELEEDTYGFDIVKCPYYDTCKRYGCPEIVTAFCDSDDASYGDLHKNLIWKRTGTIGHGCPLCDFRIQLKKE